MTTDLQRFVHDRLEPLALAFLELSRPDDTYRIIIEKKPHSPIVDLNETNAFDLITSGSRWSHLLGWRSLFGLSFILTKKTWLAIGIESFLPHSTRGAFLVSKTYIFEPSRAKDIAYQLENLEVPKVQPAQIDYTAVHRYSNGLVRTASQTPDDHKAIEYWIIDQAIAKYKKGKSIYWRSLAFSDDHFQERYRQGKRLLCTTPGIEAELSNHVPCRFYCLPPKKPTSANALELKFLRRVEPEEEQVTGHSTSGGERSSNVSPMNSDLINVHRNSTSGTLCDKVSLDPAEG